MTELPAEVDEQPPLADVRGRQRSVTFDISASAVAKIVVGLLALGFIGDLAGQMRDVFVWTLAAAFLAIALNPLVGRLEPRLGRRPAATFVFLGFVVGFLAIVAALVVPFVTQVDQLSTGLPQAISDARQDSTIKRLDNRYHIAEHAKEHVGVLPNVVFGAAGTVLGGVVAVSTVFFLTLFLLYELPGIAQMALTQMPPERRPRVVAAAQHMNRNIGGYVAGNLVISLICGARDDARPVHAGRPLLSGAGCVHGRVRPDPPGRRHDRLGGRDRLGFIFVDTHAGIIMFVIVMVYQQIENHILQPLIYGRTVQIPSLVVLIAVLCGGAVLGLIGALLAIPIAGTIHAVVSELLDERAERINGMPKLGV